MKFILHKQKPIPQKAGVAGYINGEDGELHFFINDKLVHSLHKPDIVFISKDSMLVRGYEPAGFNKSGWRILKYQEWMLRNDPQSMV